MDMKVGIRNDSPLYSLWLELFEHCHAGDTGTVFIATQENRSGQLVIHRGHLIGAAYGGEYNYQALSALSVLDNARYSYTADLIFPIPETLLPDDATILLDQLGFQHYLQDLADPPCTEALGDEILNPSPASDFPESVEMDHPPVPPAVDHELDKPIEITAPEPTPEARTVTQVYRGQKITKVIHEETPTQPTRSKSVRMYRGQVVRS